MTRRASLALVSPPVPAIKRVAIYTRKSTAAGLEQEFNSLDAQREACEAYVRNQAALGWQLAPARYDDGGFTGANIERPAFQRLLADVAAGRIDVVVCYKIDRIARSLPHFMQVMDRFTAANVCLVSITQHFSTGDAMGKLTLHLLASFAEFERDLIADRTRDKIAASRRKGKWTGGPPPLGYDPVGGKLVVNEAEAALVRRVYELYLGLRSAVAVANALNAEHRRTKSQVSRDGGRRGGRSWDKISVLRVLRSPVVAGLMTCGSELHDGEHQAIVERALYDRVQEVLNDGGGKGVRHGRNPEYILTGILRCALCGGAFTPASARRGKRIYRYYRCSTRGRGGREACPSGPLPASAIEEFVAARLRDELADGKLAGEVTQAVRDRVAKERAALQAERKELPSQIAQVASEGQRLVEGIGRLQGTARRLLDAKLQATGDHLGQLETRLAEVQRRLALLEDLEVEAGWVATCLADFGRVWDALTPENRGRLVRAVVSKVEVDEPNDDVRVFLADLGPAADSEVPILEAVT